MELHQKALVGNLLAHQQSIDHFRGDHHPALILSGPEGIGKASFAGQLACWLLGSAAIKQGQIVIQHDHPTTRMMINRSHADFLLISPEKYALKSGQIPVEALHEIHHFAHRQGASDYRVILIDALDNAVPNLSHALLKLLEEPPKNVVFLLIVHRLGAVLETIRSRTSRINFSVLKAEEMKILQPKNTHQTSDDITDLDDAILALSAGIARNYFLLQESETADILHKFQQYMHDSDPHNIHRHHLLTIICQKKTDHLTPWALISRWWVRHLLREHSLGHQEKHPKALDRLLAPFRNRLINAKTVENLEKSLTALDKIHQPPAYLDAEQTLLTILTSWHGLAHPNHSS